MRSGRAGDAEIGIHPTALVGQEVRLGAGTEVGPFCQLDGRVRIGERCRLGVGVVVGSPPMDRRYQGEDTGVVIGSDNVFCEYVTVNRATGPGTATVIGDGNFVMAYVHIGHNSRVGNGCTLTNGVQLAGHVEVGDGANLGGLVGVHQFCRIGELAMIGACSYVNKDIPPFFLAAGRPCRVRGVNVTGLERAGVSADAVERLKTAFRLLYRSELNLSQALGSIESGLLARAGPGAGLEQLRRLVEFMRSGTRGIELRTGQDTSDDEVR